MNNYQMVIDVVQYANGEYVMEAAEPVAQFKVELPHWFMFNDSEEYVMREVPELEKYKASEHYRIECRFFELVPMVGMMRSFKLAEDTDYPILEPAKD